MYVVSVISFIVKVLARSFSSLAVRASCPAQAVPAPFQGTGEPSRAPFMPVALRLARQSKACLHGKPRMRVGTAGLAGPGP